MTALISLLTGGFGIARAYPLITGLLLLSLTGMTWTHFKTKAAVEQKYKAAKIEAIEKDKEQNDRLREEAEKLIEKAQNETAKAEKITTLQIENIKSIRPNQCIDVRLSDIGLQ